MFWRCGSSIGRSNGCASTHGIPEFQAALRQVRADAYAQTKARLQQGSSAAASVLLKVMLDPATPAATKVRAAECVLNHTEKAVELEDIEGRIGAQRR